MNFKEKICVIIVFCMPLCGFCQKNAYKSKREQTALKMAYDILKVYYPSNELCVSDSIWDLDYWFYLSTEMDEENRKYFEYYRIIEKGGKYDNPVYSKHIFKLLKNENCDNSKYKYVADFSAPNRNFILCEILPIDRRIGIKGTPIVPVFLFKYDENGEIIQINRHLVNIN